MLVGVESDAGHEAKGLVEVLEGDGALDSLTAVDEGPARELGEGIGLFLGGQLLEGHFLLLLCGAVSGSGVVVP